ncbi:ABC transporter permease [Bartonella apis]|uniref:ABC transporter permease n=1 Tax=Bartonella apis TaxID=1686310 RepID=UPI0018DE3E3C|nr:ABC transporter permease [Bartonella apis]MBI0177156.1 ABC transporter permease [Bartonella apis]
MFKNEKTLQALLVVVVFILVVGFWETSVRLWEVPTYLLPPPSLIFYQLVRLIKSTLFWDNLGVTMAEVLLGYICGIVLAAILGVAISQVRVFQLALLPYIIAFQTIPTVALAPIFLQWFGYGIASKIVMAALISFFPMLINVIAGLQSAGREEIQMLKAFGANEIQILLKVKLPASLPFVFAGLGLGIIFALIGAIVAEFVGAQKGLGKMLMQFNEQFNIAGQFAILVILALIGVIMHLMVGFAKHRIIFWDGQR